MTAAAAAQPGRAPARPARLRVPAALLILVVAVAVYVAVGVSTGQRDLFTVSTVASVMQRSVALGIVALGQTFAILVGSIDLSVGFLISVSAVMASYIMQGETANVLPAVLAVLAIGAAVGVINGLLVTRLRVNPLIATLGVGLILQGFLSTSFENFAGSVPRSFEFLAYGEVAGLPFSVLFLLALTAAAALALRFTRFGARLYAVGGNVEGARLAGIHTDRVIIGAHVLCSLAASVAGLYLASRLRSGAPWVGRDGVYDLESIAVVVIGGTALAGGRGGVVGTLAGVLVFGLLDAIFNLVGVDAFLKQVLRGAIIIAAVALYTFRSREHVA